MSLHLYFLLSCWISCTTAIPLGPFRGPDYTSSLWSNIPLVKNFRPQAWPQYPHNTELRSTHKVPQQDGDEEPPATNPGWFDPRTNGGRLLDFTTPRFGEPLNIIISGNSDPFVLTEDGLHAYAKSLGFSEECLGLHVGDIHDADLGDGDIRKPEQFLARQDYFPIWGTCWESLAGGNHFRAWKQNGTLANSGAWFIGASKELDSRHHHRIAPDGYNLGRDWLVNRAISGGNWKGMSWKAEVEWQTDLLEAGKKGVNHGIAQDGRVAVLTVYQTPSSSFSNRTERWQQIYHYTRRSLSIISTLLSLPLR